jgi:hypothetical protein
MNHLGDTNKMVGDTPRMDESAHDDGAIWQTGCDIERELNAANQRIKRLEEAGNALLWYFCPKNTGDISFLQSEAIKQWTKAKEAKL